MGSRGSRQNSRGTPSFLLQLEKKQEILPSMRDEAPFHCGISREIPPSLLSLKRVLDTVDAPQKVPRHNRLHKRGTPSVPQQLKKSSVFPASSRHEFPFPCFVGEGMLAIPLHLKGRWSQLETREKLQGSCHHSKRPRCPNPLQINLIPLH